VTKVTANTLEELVARLEDVNADTALAEIRAYNEAVRSEIPGGTGLTNGSVFGRIAGASAAKTAKSESQSKRVAGT